MKLAKNLNQKNKYLKKVVYLTLCPVQNIVMRANELCVMNTQNIQGQKLTFFLSPRLKIISNNFGGLPEGQSHSMRFKIVNSEKPLL